MQNYQRAMDLTAVSTESAGLADARYSAYLESVAGKQKKMTAAAEEFNDTIINSKFIGYVYDVGAALLKVFTMFQKVTGGMGMWVVTGLTVVNVLKKIDLAAKLENVPVIGTVLNSLKTGVTSLIASFNALNLTWVQVAGYAAAVVAAIVLIKKVIDTVDPSIETLNKRIDTYTLKISDLRAEEEQLKSSDGVTEGQKAELAFIEKEIALNEELKTQEEQRKYEKESSTGFSIQPERTTIFGTVTGSEISLQKSLRLMQTDYDKLTKARTKFNNSANPTKEQAKDVENLQKNVYSLASEYEAFIKTIDDHKAAGAEISDQDQALYDSAKKWVDTIGSDAVTALGDTADAESDVSDETDDLATTLDDLMQTTDDALKAATSSASDYKNALSDLSTVMSEMNDSGELSVDTILDLVASGSDLIGFLQEENGTYKITQESMQAYFEYKRQATLDDLASQITAAASSIQNAEIEIDANTSVAEAAKGTAEVEAGAATSIVNSYMARATAAQQAAQAEAIANASGIARSSFSGGTATQNAQIAEQKLKLTALINSYNVLSNMTFPKYVSAQNAAASATKSSTSATSEQEKALKAAQEAAEKYLDTLNDEKDKQDAIAKAIQKIIQKEIDALNDQKDALDDTYDARIDALKEQETALEDQENTEDKLLEIEKARNELQKAQSQRNVRRYEEGKGWVWTSDASTVSSAQTKLDDLEKSWKREQEKAAIESTIKALEAEKKAAEDNISAQIKTLQKLKDGWNEATDTTMTNLNKWTGALEYVTQFENGNYNTRISMMNSFTSNYIGLCNQIINAEKAVAQAKANAEAASNVSYSGGSYSGGGSSSGGSSTPVAAHIVSKRYTSWLYNGSHRDASGRTTYTYLRHVYYTWSDGHQSTSTESRSSTVRLTASQMSASYASGGVDTKGGEAILHGTPNHAEVIFNAAQGKALYNWVNNLANAERAGTINSTTNSKQSSIVINRLEVTAPNNATIDTIITSARQKIQTTR